jgi:hypothetical protein
MKTYRLQFLKVNDGNNDNSIPVEPRCYIGIKNYEKIYLSENGFNKDDKRIVITPECMTVHEFQEEVCNLIEELNTIGKQAEKYFASIKK